MNGSTRGPQRKMERARAVGRSAAMNNATAVLLTGMAAIGALLLAQWRLVAARPEHVRTERLRGALYLALLFVSFAVLHRYLSQEERPKEQCCLILFGEEEPLPPGTGPQVEPPPAPPLPPSR